MKLIIISEPGSPILAFFEGYLMNGGKEESTLREEERKRNTQDQAIVRDTLYKIKTLERSNKLIS